MHPGIYPGLSNYAYHKDKFSVSRSGLMEFKKSPYHYWSKHINPDAPEQEQTPAMMFGQAFHSFILEPSIFENEYAVMPKAVLLRDVGREEYDRMQSLREQIEKSGKNILTMDAFGILFEMERALKGNKLALELIQGAQYEQSLFWKDKDSELILKARPDILHEHMIVDLKTCTDASPRKFQSAIADGGYHIQGAMIRDGYRELTGNDIPHVINIAIEKTYPYSIGIYLIDEAALDTGALEYKQLALELKRAIDNNDFGGYPPQTLGLPKWYF